MKLLTPQAVRDRFSRPVSGSKLEITYSIEGDPPGKTEQQIRESQDGLAPRPRPEGRAPGKPEEW